MRVVSQLMVVEASPASSHQMGNTRMHSYEEATIRAFIARDRRTRWLDALASPKRRSKFLDRLNHCRDFDERYATELDSDADVLTMLKSLGAPETCCLISDTPHLDGKELPIGEAVADVEQYGGGTLVCCLPGHLAFFYGENGEQRLLLQRSGK
jgi:hypothetical protein